MARTLWGWKEYGDRVMLADVPLCVGKKECLMIQTVEAVIDSEGRVRLLGEIHVSGPRRALVTVLEEPAVIPGETALLAEAALAEDWNRPEEEEAWSHLQPEK